MDNRVPVSDVAACSDNGRSYTSQHIYDDKYFYNGPLQ